MYFNSSYVDYLYSSSTYEYEYVRTSTSYVQTVRKCMYSTVLRVPHRTGTPGSTNVIQEFLASVRLSTEYVGVGVHLNYQAPAIVDSLVLSAAKDSRKRIQRRAE